MNAKGKIRVARDLKPIRFWSPPSKKHMLPIESFGMMVQEENRSPYV